MTVSCAVGAFNTGTGAIGTTIDVIPSSPAITISGVSVVKFFMVGRTENVDTSGRATRYKGFGAALSSTVRFGVVSQSQDAVAAATGGSYHSNAACIVSCDVGTATDGLIDFDSWLSDGFRLIVDDVMPRDYRVGYIIYTGLDAAAFGTWLDTSSTGNKVITAALAFQPDVVTLVAASIDAAAPGGRAGNEMLGLGFAVSPTQRGTLTGGSDEGSATMDTDSYCTDAECLSCMVAAGGSVLGARWDFVSHNADGFTLNQIIVPPTLCRNYFIAMKGGVWSVQSVLTQTDTSTDINTGSLGGTPAGVFIISACKVEHTVGAPTVHDSWSVGAASDATHRFVGAIHDEDAVLDSEVTTASEHDAVYASINTSSVLEALMDVKTWADPITFIMDDADPSQKFVTMLVVANAVGGGASDPHDFFLAL